MNNRSLAIGLAASVGLNLFALGAAGAFWLSQSRTDVEVRQEQPQPRQRGTQEIVGELPEAVRGQVRSQLRASALAARPDFEEARTQRRAAVAAARADTFDPTEVRSRLEASRAAELRGRARLESDAVDVLGELSPDDRRTLSRILVRRGRGDGGGRPRRHRDHRSDATAQPEPDQRPS